MTSRTTDAGTDAVRYDPLRRPVRLKRNQQTVWRAAYDGDGARRKRLDSTGVIHYLGAYERNVGNGSETTTETMTKYYAALGRLLAFRKISLLDPALRHSPRIKHASFQLHAPSPSTLNVWRTPFHAKRGRSLPSSPSRLTASPSSPSPAGTRPILSSPRCSLPLAPSSVAPRGRNKGHPSVYMCRI